MRRLEAMADRCDERECRRLFSQPEAERNAAMQRLRRSKKHRGDLLIGVVFDSLEEGSGATALGNQAADRADFVAPIDFDAHPPKLAGLLEQAKRTAHVLGQPSAEALKAETGVLCAIEAPLIGRSKC